MARCLIAHLEAIDECPDIDGCTALTYLVITVNRMKYHVCYGRSIHAPQPLEIDITSGDHEYIHFSRDQKYILMLPVQLLWSYSEDEGRSFGHMPVVKGTRNGICMAQRMAHTAYSMFLHATTMQIPKPNSVACDDTNLVSINDTHAVRTGYWTGLSKLCYIDVRPVTSGVYLPYEWVCVNTSSVVSDAAADDDPGWLEKALRNVVTWLYKEAVQFEHWVASIAWRVLRFVGNELLDLLGWLWYQLLDYDRTHYVFESLLVLFVVTYRSNFPAGLLLLLILLASVGFHRRGEWRIMEYFE